MKNYTFALIILGSVLLSLVDVLASNIHTIYSQKVVLLKVIDSIDSNITKELEIVLFKPTISKMDILSLEDKVKEIKIAKSKFIYSPKFSNKEANHLGLLNFKKMSKTMSFIESSHKKDVINRCGFSGEYQFGLAPLEDLGYIKKGEYARMLKMNVGQRVFMIKHVKWVKGMSWNKFIKYHQYEAFKRYCILNYKNLKKNGYLTGNEDIKYVKGLLFASHLVGVNSVKRLLSKKKGKYVDANGMSAYIYFHIGYNVA